MVQTATFQGPVPNWRLTEDTTLHGLVTRERGGLVEYISYREASRRLRLAALSDHTVAAAADRTGSGAGHGRSVGHVRPH